MYFSCKSNFSSPGKSIISNPPPFIPSRARFKPLRIKYVLTVNYQSRTRAGFNIMFMFSTPQLISLKVKT